jgi:hypothetical protein
MKPLYRYGIIALCFVAFFALAPVLVVYTTGEVYDWSTHRFVETGILSATTTPSGAKVYINGKLAGSTPARVRFLAPGDYDVKVTKPGYDDWDKRLAINGKLTTYANSGTSSVYLYKSVPPQRAVAAQVQDFLVTGNTLTYVTPSALWIDSVGNPGSAQQYSAPAGASFAGARLTTSPNGQFVLVRTPAAAAVFSLSTKVFTLLPIAAPGTVQLANDGTMYWLNGTSLGKTAWQSTPVVTSPVAQNVLTFSAAGSGVYFVQKNTGAAAGALDSLVFLQTPTLQATTLRQDLPNWTSAQLYVNSQNQIFINGDGALYAVNSGLNQIGSNVNSVLFYEQYGEALLATGNELDLYSTGTGQSQLVSRTSAAVTSAQATPATGAVFFIGGGELQAIETDVRDRQNSYAFAAVSSPSAKFWVSDDARYVVLLDGTALSQLQVR